MTLLRYPNLRRHHRLPPVGATLDRARLVAGLRAVFQRTRLELALTSADRDEEVVLAVAAVLDDVADEFGLSAGEREDILAEYARQLGESLTAECQTLLSNPLNGKETP